MAFSPSVFPLSAVYQGLAPAGAAALHLYDNSQACGLLH